MKPRIIKYTLLLLLLLFLSAVLFPGAQTFGELQKMTDQDLGVISGHGGVSIGLKNIQMFGFIDSYTYYATDNGGSFSLRNIQFTDGQGGDVMKFNFDYTGNRIIDENGDILLESVDDSGVAGYDGRMSSSGLIYFNIAAFEVATEDDWDTLTNPASTHKVMGVINVPSWDQEVGMNIGNFIFSDGTKTYDLGSIDIGRIDVPTFDFYFGPHAESGIDFEYGFEQHIDHIGYFYGNDFNTDHLVISDFHFGSSFGFGTVGDDPRFPSTWTTDIGNFKIGDMFGSLANNEHSRPAQFDVGAIPDGAGMYEGAIIMTLPMSGSIRFENVDFGGIDFGPGAIDGIEAYRMNVFLIP